MTHWTNLNCVTASKRSLHHSSNPPRSFKGSSLIRSVEQSRQRDYSTSPSSIGTSTMNTTGDEQNLKEQQYEAEALSSAFINASMPSPPTSNPNSDTTPPPEEADATTAQTQTQAQAQALHSTSSFLAAQAEVEEAREAEEEEQVERLKAHKRLEAKIEGQLEAWDGDETRERMIRRILQDQYKPLRVKGHKKAIPGAPIVLHPSVFASEDLSSKLIPTRTSSAQEVDPPSTPLKPWEYEYKTPASHGTSYTHPHSTRSSLLIRSGPVKTTKSQRVASAREKTMDYTFGVGVTSPDGGRTRVMVPSFDAELEAPSSEKGGDSLRAWDGFVEDKVNQAIRNGLFKDLKGRGKPLKVDEAASNPFLPREDRLINRVVKGQGAMPPWIEMQQELQLNLSAFRNELRSSYTRRVTRMLSLPGNLSRASVSTILNDTHRDSEWEARERSYHLASIASLNALTRRFNIVAPYTARRGSLDLEKELEECRRYCRPWIVDELIKRIEGRSEMVLNGEEEGAGKGKGKGKAQGEGEEIRDRGTAEERFWPALRRGVWELLGIGGNAPAAGAGAAMEGGATKVEN